MVDADAERPGPCLPWQLPSSEMSGSAAFSRRDFGPKTQLNCGSTYKSTPWLENTNEPLLITYSKQEFNIQFISFSGKILRIII